MLNRVLNQDLPEVKYKYNLSPKTWISAPRKDIMDKFNNKDESQRKDFASHRNQHICEQDRRWNADKPSATIDPYIPTWLTTKPANHRPANFWFFSLEMKLWKVVQPQVQLNK